MRERGNMQSITLQLFPATFSLPAAILFQVSGAGSLCFERSCGGKNPQTWEEWEKPHSGTVLSSCKCWEQSIVCRELLGCMARQTQTDVEAFAPYGTSSARHKEQTGHAENRPTKWEAACKQFAGALQVSFQSEHASSSGLDSPSTYWVRGRDAEWKSWEDWEE